MADQAARPGEGGEPPEMAGQVPVSEPPGGMFTWAPPDPDRAAAFTPARPPGQAGPPPEWASVRPRHPGRRLLIVIAVVAVAVLAAGGTGLAVALGSGGGPHRAPGRVTLIRFPRSLLGFRRNGTGDMQRLRTRDGSLTKAMFAGPIRNALYGQFPPGLMVVAGRWSAAGRAAFRHTGQVPFEKSVLAGLFAAGPESFPAGPRDGRQVCGSITSHGPRMIACVWADSTMVWAVVYEWSVSSLSDAAAKTIEIRAAAELHPAGSRSPSA